MKRITNLIKTAGVLGLCLSSTLFAEETATIASEYTPNYTGAYSLVELGEGETANGYVVKVYSYSEDTGEMVSKDYVLTFDTLGTVVDDGSETTTYYFNYNSSSDAYVATTEADYDGSGFIVESNTASSKNLTITSGSLNQDFINISSGFVKVGTDDNSITTYYEIDSVSGVFVDPLSPGETGGISVYGDSTVDKISGIFIDNDGSWSGAICNNGSINEIDGVFINNDAVWSTGGGAIMNSGEYIGKITGDFINNTGDYGGAIYNDTDSALHWGVYTDYESNIEYISANFIQNSAVKYGGAIYNVGGTIGTITESLFSGNTTVGTTYSRGGAIYNSGSDSTIVEISNSYFYVNSSTGTTSAATGGAIYNSFAYIDKISNSYFYGNYATSSTGESNGGAIYFSGGNIETIDNCAFYNNYATSTNITSGYGGAIYFYSPYDDVTISNSSFVGNYAGVSGGAIYFSAYSSAYDGDMVLSNTSFTGNSAVWYGGAIYNNNSYASLIMTDISFAGNSVVWYGGAIYNANSYTDITMTDVEFSGNTAFKGGAIMNYGNIVAYLTSDHDGGYWAYDNDADYGGLLYAAEGSSATIIVGDNVGEVLVHDNTASVAGGFIYAEAGSTNTFDIGEGSTVVVGDFTVSHTGDEDYAHTDSIYGEVGYTDENGSYVSGAAFIKNGKGTLLVHSNAEIYGSLAVNEGSLIIEGDLEDDEGDEHWYEYVLATEAESLTNVKATLMLGSSLYLGESITVGTVLDEYASQIVGDANTFYLASDSVLVLHAHATGGVEGSNDEDFDSSTNTSAIMGDGDSTIYVGNNATLMVYGAIDAGTTEIRILQGFDVMANIDDSAIFASSSTDTDTSTDTGDSSGTESGIATMSMSVTTLSNDISLMSEDPAADPAADPATDPADTSSATTTSFSFGTVYVLDPRYEGYTQAEFTYNDGDDGSGGFVLTLKESDEGIANVGQMAAIAGVSSTLNLLVNSARDTTMARFSAFDKSYNVGSRAFKKNSFCKCAYDNETGQFYCDGNCQCCGTKEEQNYGIWATPMYIYSEARGLNAGDFSTGYDMHLGGGNVGIDYTINEKYRFGLAFHGGAGDSNSVGDFNETSNDFTFYSTTLYAGYKKDNFLVYADLNVAYSNNELEQLNDVAVLGSEINAEVDAYIFDASIRAEYIIEMENYWITPHVSFTYSYIDVDDYSVEQYGKDIYNVDSHGQSLITIPVGVMFTTAIDLQNDWIFSPILDLGVIFTLGDLYAESTASFEDFSTYFLSIEAYNRYTFQGLVGFELNKDRHRIGFAYKIEASENITAHNFRLNYRYDF